MRRAPLRKTLIDSYQTAADAITVAACYTLLKDSFMTAGSNWMTMQSEKVPLLQTKKLNKTFGSVGRWRMLILTSIPAKSTRYSGKRRGKSTLIKLITGVYSKDTGSILLDGKPIEPHSPHEAQALGISTVYQEINLIPMLSVAENLFLGRQPMRWGLSIRARSMPGRKRC